MLCASLARAQEGEVPESPEPAPPIEEPASPLSVGDLTLVGKNCFNWDETPVVVAPYRILLPLRNWLKREDGKKDLTGTCQFSIPLQVPPGVRLRLEAVSAQTIMNLYPLTESNAKVEVVVSADKSISAWIRGHSLSQRQITWDEIYAEKELVGECGQSWILKGNTEVTILGGKGLATSKIDQIAIDYSLESCEN